MKAVFGGVSIPSNRVFSSDSAAIEDLAVKLVSQSPQIGSSLLIQSVSRMKMWGHSSQSPQIGSSLLINEPSVTPPNNHPVSIPSNRVFSSDKRWESSIFRRTQVSIPSNRVFSSDEWAGETAEKAIHGLNPLKSGLLFWFSLKGGDLPDSFGLNPLKSGLLFWLFLNVILFIN